MLHTAQTVRSGVQFANKASHSSSSATDPELMALKQAHDRGAELAAAEAVLQIRTESLALLKQPVQRTLLHVAIQLQSRCLRCWQRKRVYVDVHLLQHAPSSSAFAVLQCFVTLTGSEVSNAMVIMKCVWPDGERRAWQHKCAHSR